MSASDEELVTLCKWRGDTSDHYGDDLVSLVYHDLRDWEGSSKIPENLREASRRFNQMSEDAAWKFAANALGEGGPPGYCKECGRDDSDMAGIEYDHLHSDYDLIDVWIVYKSDEDGNPTEFMGTCSTEERAEALAKHTGSKVEKRRAILPEKDRPHRVYILDPLRTDEHVLDDTHVVKTQILKEQALEKLTNAEKEALGFLPLKEVVEAGA